MDHRVEQMLAKIEYLLKNWPKVTYRDISQLLGQINTMHPVLEGKATFCFKNLQTFENIRHFKEISWDTVINTYLVELYKKAKQEIEFRKDNILLLNFSTIYGSGTELCWLGGCVGSCNRWHPS
jgi:hypothetical protein